VRGELDPAGAVVVGLILAHRDGRDARDLVQNSRAVQDVVCTNLSRAQAVMDILNFAPDPPADARTAAPETCSE
jgi:hypothetical protein